MLYSLCVVCEVLCCVYSLLLVRCCVALRCLCVVVRFFVELFAFC